MSVQSKRARSARKKRASQSKPKNYKKSYWLLIFIFVFVLFKLIFRTDATWNGVRQITVAMSGEDVSLFVFNPDQEEIIKIIVPGDTQITAARQYGVWKVSKLWTLGNEEGLGGSLMTESITNHLEIPTQAWMSGNLDSYFSGNVFQIIRTVLFPGKTNLTFADRFRLMVYSLKVTNSNRVTVNLADTAYLQKTTLTDGNSGYTIAGSMPQSLRSIFAGKIFAGISATAVIIDKSGKPGLAEATGEIIEIVGAKVVSVINKPQEEVDCVVKSTVEDAFILADLLGCKKINQKPDNLDMEITIGEKFAKRF